MELVCERHAATPQRARAQLDAYAGDLMPGDRLADARLLLTELVTNAVLHGRGDVRILVEVSGDVLHVEVVDEGDGFRPARDRHEREGGWGLGIVEALADRWGVFGGSTHVWFEIERRAYFTEPASRPCTK